MVSNLPGRYTQYSSHIQVDLHSVIGLHVLSGLIALLMIVSNVYIECVRVS